MVQNKASYQLRVSRKAMLHVHDLHHVKIKRVGLIWPMDDLDCICHNWCKYCRHLGGQFRPNRRPYYPKERLQQYVRFQVKDREQTSRFMGSVTFICSSTSSALVNPSWKPSTRTRGCTPLENRYSHLYPSMADFH